jgi:hypothetical protein
MGRFALPVVKGRKIVARRAWDYVGGVYDFRICPDCGAIVLGDAGQALHATWHENTDEALYGRDEDEPDGYVWGSDGPVPNPEYDERQAR